MSADVLVVLLAALIAGAGGLLVPALIVRLPEPPPAEAAETEPDPEADTEADTAPGPVEPDEEPKQAYASIGARSGLGLRSALVASVCGALLGIGTGADWSLLWLVPLAPVGVALSVVDWHTRLLPRLVVIPATLAAIVVVVTVGLATGERDTLVRALVGMVVVRSFFWMLWWIRSAGMGFGDVRLAAPVGLVLGWMGWGSLAIGVWVGFVAFALPGLLLAVVRRDRSLLRKPFPYGPFMLAGTLVGLVWGPALSGLLWG